MYDRTGQQFGNYRLIRLLGRGGFAEVYLGAHIHIQTQAAIKVLSTQLVAKDLERFIREARTIGSLEHPHIVRVFDFGIQEEIPFLVMNYASNGTLRQRHPKGSRVSLNEVLSYVHQVASALRYAHDRKVIHRDVKPENMLLGSQGEILLSDFGIAVTTTTSTFQQTKTTAGTAAYMSPEQILGRPCTASDQYALGIIVYEWLSGGQPFQGSFFEMCVQHMHAPVPSLRKTNSEISPEMEQCITKALSKDPKERFANIQDFAIALQASSQRAVPVSTSVLTQQLLPESFFPSITSQNAPTFLKPLPISVELEQNAPTFRKLPLKAPFSAEASQTTPTFLTIPPEVTPLPESARIADTGQDMPSVSKINAATSIPTTKIQKQNPTRKRLVLVSVRVGICVILLAVGFVFISPKQPPHPALSQVRQSPSVASHSTVSATSALATNTPTSIAMPMSVPTQQPTQGPTKMPPGSTWTLQRSPTGQDLSDIAWSGSLYVAVGKGGTILTSSDGRSWTFQNSPTSVDLCGVDWVGSMFIILGSGGMILTSPDGRSWTQQAAGLTQNRLFRAARSNSMFIIVGGGGTILTSSDGSSWTQQNSGTAQWLYGVAWSGSRFVAVAGSGVLLVSTDGSGSTWNQANSGSSQWLNEAAWSGSMFVVVGYSGTILSSPDGSTWSFRGGMTQEYLLGVIWTGSQFAIVGNGGTILTSPDGSTWTTHNAPTLQNLEGVAWSGSQFVTVGLGGTILTSP